MVKVEQETSGLVGFESAGPELRGLSRDSIWEGSNLSDL